MLFVRAGLLRLGLVNLGRGVRLRSFRILLTSGSALLPGGCRFFCAGAVVFLRSRSRIGVARLVRLAQFLAVPIQTEIVQATFERRIFHGLALKRFWIDLRLLLTLGDTRFCRNHRVGQVPARVLTFTVIRSAKGALGEGAAG